MNQELLLVDTSDRVIGYGEKMEVHRKGQLHRAFSIFVLNQKDELLLQQRAASKYHSAGLWANTCCSHPIKGEAQEITVHRRLREEMGFDCELTRLFDFIYKAPFENGLTEYEYDHVYLGRFDGIPKPNPSEVSDLAWVSLDNLNHELRTHPEKYVAWIKPAFEKFYDWYQSAGS